MKRLLQILIFFVPLAGLTQKIDSVRSAEILSAGCIDLVQNGQMNASARIFRLYIGEPKKFQIPVSLYTGVSANNFSNNLGNDDVLLTLIDPATGIFNLALDGTAEIIGKKKALTSLQLQYQAGLRFISIYNRLRFINNNFLNLIYGGGLTFSTGAWEKDKVSNLGMFWLNLRLIYSRNPSRALDGFFPANISTSLWAYSAGTGIEISQTLNVKIFYFRFLNNLQTEAFTEPYIQLSLNYSLR